MVMLFLYNIRFWILQVFISNFSNFIFLVYILSVIKAFYYCET